jgi:hypothetical protein
VKRAALWLFEGRACVILGEQVRYTRTGGRELRYGIQFLDDREERSVTQATFARTAKATSERADA